jgi:hypothetical protein
MKTFLTVLMGIFVMAAFSSAQDMKDITGGAKVTGEKSPAGVPVTRPSVIYVQDFDLGAPEIKKEKRLLGGPRGGLRGKLRGQTEDSREPALKIENLMAESLVSEIQKRGIRARRLYEDEAVPRKGWLVRGVFTQVDEGNRVRRAVIGFGSGATRLDLNVNVTDLTTGGVEPFYKVDTAKGSGKLPGAIITLNPYVAAAKFVLNTNSLEKDVRRTASKIADQLAEQVGLIEKKSGRQ